MKRLTFLVIVASLNAFPIFQTMKIDNKIIEVNMFVPDVSNIVSTISDIATMSNSYDDTQQITQISI